MSEHNKTEEFLQKLAPCIERGDLDACVEEAARVAKEMGVGAGKLLELSTEKKQSKDILKTNPIKHIWNVFKLYTNIRRVNMSELLIQIPKDIPVSSLKRKIDDLIQEEEIRWVLFEKCKKELSIGENELEELEIVREKAWKETKKKYGL
ncbi:MAG: hypothetical protein WC556_05755 [Candidatus Methanoperedens sp.]